MKHRYVSGKIRNEVEKVLGSAEAQSTDPQNLTTLFTPVSMPYVMAVFYEALRFYPPVPFEFKQAEQAVTLPDGTFLPKGAVVLWCPWAMNRSKITWGDDADSFRPERWLADGGTKVLSRTVSEFPVFNGGSRTCLGKRMAEVIAVQVIAAMAWNFDFVPADGGVDRVSKTSLTLPMEGGLPCFVKARTRNVDQYRE
jgi:cytochrome P450